MSSNFGPDNAACRLHLSEDRIWLERPGFSDEHRSCEAGTAEYLGALRELAMLCTAPVVAVLPAGSFAVTLVGQGPLGRLRAQRMLRRALGTERGQIRVAAMRAGGETLLIGLPVDTLCETARFLGAQGIPLAAVEAPSTLVAGSRVPAFHIPPRVAEAPLSRRIWAASRCYLQGSGWRVPAGAAAGLVLLGLLAASGSEEGEHLAEKSGGAVSSVRNVAAITIPNKPAEQEAAEGPEASVASSAPPLQVYTPSAVRAPRPMDRPHLALLRSEAPQRRAPSALVRAVEERPSIIMASRSIPPELREAALEAAARSVAGGSASALRVAELGPVPRPRSVGEPAGAGTSIKGAVLRPLPRPGTAIVVAPAAGAGDDRRPYSRPSDEDARLAEAVAAAVQEVAALGPSVGQGGRPKPRGFAAQASDRVLALASEVQRSEPVTPPVAAAPVRTEPVRAQPAEMARVQPPAPVVAPPPVQAVPVRQASPPVQAVVQGSGNVALIGVFGTSSRRHALVRLPNGSVQRVRPGESVSGMQIAAVGEDSVRVRVDGRDGVLRLPD